MLNAPQSMDPRPPPPHLLPYESGQQPPPFEYGQNTALVQNKQLPPEPAALVEKDYSSDGSKGDQPMSKLTMFSILALALTYVSTNIGGFFNGVVILYMAHDFGLSKDQVEWLQIIPDLLFACSAPIVGYLTDLYGRRIAIFGGMFLHSAGTIIVATAPGFAPAVVGLAISGFGEAVAELSATAAIAELVPVRKRGLFLALITLLTLPFVPSVLYAELISLHSSWRWCWGIVVIWSVLSFGALTITYYRLKLERPGAETRHTTLKQIDYLGIFLLIAGSVLLIIGLESSQGYGWSSPFVIGALIVGLVLLLILCVWEWKGAKAPLIPPRLFRGQRVVGLAFGVVFICGMYFAAAANIGPYIFTTTFAASPLQVGLMALGPSFGIMVGATGFNFLLSVSRGAARELLAVAAALMAAFGGALAASTPDTMTQYIIFGSFAGIGIGGLLEPTSTVATFACPQDLIGTVVSLSAFLRTIGGTFGYVIFASIATAKGYAVVARTIGMYAVKAGLNESVAKDFAMRFAGKVAAAPPGVPPAALTVDLPGVTPDIIQAAAQGAQQGYSIAYDTMYYAQIPFGVIAVVLCISLPNIRNLINDHIVVRSR